MLWGQQRALTGLPPSLWDPWQPLLTELLPVGSGWPRVPLSAALWAPTWDGSVLPMSKFLPSLFRSEMEGMLDKAQDLPEMDGCGEQRSYSCPDGGRRERGRQKRPWGGTDAPPEGPELQAEHGAGPGLGMLRACHGQASSQRCPGEGQLWCEDERAGHMEHPFLPPEGGPYGVAHTETAIRGRAHPRFCQGRGHSAHSQQAPRAGAPWDLHLRDEALTVPQGHEAKVIHDCVPVSAGADITATPSLQAPRCLPNRDRQGTPGRGLEANRMRDGDRYRSWEPGLPFKPPGQYSAPSAGLETSQRRGSVAYKGSSVIRQKVFLSGGKRT